MKDKKLALFPMITKNGKYLLSDSKYWLLSLLLFGFNLLMSFDSFYSGLGYWQKMKGIELHLLSFYGIV